MSDTVITDVDQLEIAWFNRVLARSGALTSGGVTAFEAEEPAANACSRSSRIRLSYESGSTGPKPSRLFLKICSDGAESFGPSEVHYYARDYAGLTDPPIPRCYDAQYASDPRRYHILMEDLSETHRNNWQTPPTEKHGRAVADALATLHAHWWVPKTHAAPLAMPGDAEIERYIGHIRRGLLPMIEHAGGEIDPSWPDALFEIFEKHPTRMRERTERPEGFTLVHGDVNPGNILSPTEGHRPVYLLDRQPFDWSLTTWLGVSDISYMMVHWWETEVRRQLEIPVLRQYHESLHRHGVSGYEWEELFEDYRLCAIQSIYVATEWCVLEEDRTKMKWNWLPQLQKSMTAYFDLRCGTLWR